MPREYGTPREWMDYARADLAMAQIPLPRGGLYQHLCFFAQQAAEKAIKAVLIHCGTEFPCTHSIAALVGLLPPELPRPDELTDAAVLTAHATFLRYPMDDATVDEARHRRTIALAEAVVAWAEGVIGPDREEPTDADAETEDAEP